MQLLLQWKSNKYYIFWMCVCSPRYPACNVHGLYCHLWPARLYSSFTHYFIKGTIFEKKKLFNKKCVYLCSLILLAETFLIPRRIERDIIINVCRYLSEVPVILVRFWGNFNLYWEFWVVVPCIWFELRINYQLDTIFIYFSSTCFGLTCPSSGAMDLYNFLYKPPAHTLLKIDT